MDFPDRYLRNMPSVSEAEQEMLKNASVFVAGCGGLGGYAVELLARLGVGRITCIDGDVFQPTNLNRQLFCTEANIGLAKVVSAEKRVSEINRNVKFTGIYDFLTPENAEGLTSGHSVIIDALDSQSARCVLSHAAEKAGIPFVHGAIEGFRARVYTVFPGDKMAETLFSSGAETGESSGNLSFTACFCAALQVCEAVKLILGKGNAPAGRLIEADLLTSALDVIDIS